MTPPARQAIYTARYQVRKRIEQLDNAEVRNARALLKMVRGHVDVAYLGDSTASFVAPYDTDRRPLDVMVRDELGPSLRVGSINGGSYHADLLEAYVGLLERSGHRPVVVVPLWVRGRYVPWIEHPVWGHKHAMAYIRSVAGDTPAWRVRAGFGRPDPAEFARFEALAHPTLVGDLAVRDYVTPLRDARRWDGRPVERARLIHAYHHGAALDLRSPALDAVRALGGRLARLGVGVVVYQTPVPVQSGEEHFGSRFRELAHENFTVLEAALADGFGAPVPVLQTGTMFETDEFIDVSGADEHLNERGRARLASAIADAVRQVI